VTPRIRLLLALMLSVMAVFTARLMVLQLGRAREFTAKSEENATQQQRIAPLRGRILARDGTVLADDRVAYDLMYRGGGVEDWPRLRDLLGLHGDPVPPDPAKPEEVGNGAVLAWNIPDALVAAVEERVAGQPNLHLRERVERTYPTNLAAQVVGYTALADPTRKPSYGPDDLVGVMGLEAGYEGVLHGSAGARLVEVDNRGAQLRSRLLWPATPGADITLTLDPKLQRLAADALKHALVYVNQDRERVGHPLAKQVHGALIALDPNTGEILAMASAPSFDENVFSHRPSDPAAVDAILKDDTDKPLSDRAVEAYPPASTFKIITSSTLLEDGFITPKTRYDCSARFRFGGVTFENWAGYDKGLYDVRQAIADSCNTFFWRATAATPDFGHGWAPFIQDEVRRARALGYGRALGVGLPQEKAGRVPDLAWVRSQPQYRHGWLPGFTLNTVIGQGDVLATPLQVAQLIETVAMHGQRATPHLVRAVGGAPVPRRVGHVEGHAWDTLIQGMRLMFTDFPSKRFMGPGVFPVSVAGKSGTAQTTRGKDWTHAWFMGFSPVEDPQIAVVVFIEYGGSSSRVSVPVGRDFLAGYWKMHGMEVPETP